MLRFANGALAVAAGTQAELDWLGEYLTLERVVWRAGSRQTESVGLVDALQRFPAGLLSLVLRGAQREGIVATVVPPPPQCVLAEDPEADLAWLRDYQLAAVRAAVEHRRGLLQLPTAAGKTEIAVGITRALPGRWLFLSNRGQLAKQAADRFALRGTPTGLFIEGTSQQLDLPVVCASFQSLLAALDSRDARKAKMARDLLSSATGLIVDEAHIAPAATYQRVLMLAHNAFTRIGLSATPLDRSDGMQLRTIGLFGPIIYRLEAKSLIERGMLAVPTVRLLRCVHAPSAWETYAELYQGSIVHNEARNALLVQAAQRAAKPGFLFVREVAHGKLLERALMNAGVRAQLVYGTHSVEHRMRETKRLAQGHFDFIVCSVVFQEGIDVSELRSVIQGPGGKSNKDVLQRMGRGMRPDRDSEGNLRDGGGAFEVWDIQDEGIPVLERHSRARRKAYLSQGFTTLVE